MLRFIRLATLAIPAVLWLVRKIRDRGTSGAPTAPHHPTSVHNSRARKGRSD